MALECASVILPPRETCHLPAPPERKRDVASAEPSPALAAAAFMALKSEPAATASRSAGGTSPGPGRSIDDDSHLGAAHEHLTEQYNWCIYALLGTVLIDVHMSASIACSDRDDGKSWIAYAKGGLAFVVDGMILIIIRHLGVRYAISSLLTYNLSWETSAARFWDRVNPAPNQPEDEPFDWGQYTDMLSLNVTALNFTWTADTLATIQSYIIDHWESFDFRSHGLPGPADFDSADFA